MNRLGLLVSALTLSASAVFAQDQLAKPSSTPAISAQMAPAASTNPEPWRIVPKATQEPGGASSDVRPETSDNNSNILFADPKSQVLTARVLSKLAEAEKLNGNTCYSIRSYLMARDSKDSDSTHLVSTSTCQPAQQYGLKTTDSKPHLVQP